MTRLPASGRFPAKAAASGASALSSLLFMRPRDIGLFVRSARTDAALIRLRERFGPEAAFDAVYAGGDPWASGDPRYRYQRRKYEVLSGLLPERRFARALDLGTGTGLLARRLAGQADEVLGLDISQLAVEQAQALHHDLPNLRFAQADVLDLPISLDGGFDLVVVADTLYYLPAPLDDALLKQIALRIARLLRPGGLCLLANHFFFAADPDSRLSRRIHRAFAWSPSLRVVSEHRRPFYLVSLLELATAPQLGSPSRPDLTRRVVG
jgi:SAM-dependent methyltransferase